MIALRFIKQSRILQHGYLFSTKGSRFMHHRSIPRKTLIYRYYKFFEEDPKYSQYIVGSVNFAETTWNADTFSKDEAEIINELKLKKSVEVPNLIMLLTDKNFSSQISDFKRVIRCVDNFCCEEKLSLSVKDTLRLNYSWLKLLGFNMTRLHFFPLSLEILKNALLKRLLSLQGITLTLFFTSLQTKNEDVSLIIPNALDQICRKDSMEKMTPLEIVLVANIAFRTGTKVISPIFVKHVVDVIYEDPTYLSDPAIFVSIVKTLRLNQCHDYTLLEKLKKYFCIGKNLSRYNFTALVHLLALYADASYGNREFLSYLINTTTKSMLHSGSYRPYEEKSKSSAATRVRMKDLARLLWASSYLGFKINSEMINEYVIPMILDKAQRGLYNSKLETLVDSILSLWMMGYKPLELLTYVTSRDAIEFMSKIKQVRYNYRLQLLITCITIEAPEVVKDLSHEQWITPAWSDFEEKRAAKPSADLLNVLYLVKSIAWKFGFSNVECRKAIPYLNILSISLESSDARNRLPKWLDVVETQITAEAGKASYSGELQKINPPLWVLCCSEWEPSLFL
ncbi:hypothetical protein J437_LFUL007918 [Ladona fulva]|uniref:FAST kinase leucine-rich domain-containing protein n=1 Tax=Ladona fulva TaxID=123851 RepID=A0A8K0P261_LADFU|nr:hypothetical protein J437_LFUL007918 [Ladona fulva]